MVNILEFLKLFFFPFAVAIFEVGHDLEAIFPLP